MALDAQEKAASRFLPSAKSHAETETSSGVLHFVHPYLGVRTASMVVLQEMHAVTFIANQLTTD